jgi:hypothetical protein
MTKLLAKMVIEGYRYILTVKGVAKEMKISTKFPDLKVGF